MPTEKQPDETSQRGDRVKALVQMHRVSDAASTNELLSLLRQSIEKAGDKQPERAAWLGVSSRYLRYLLSDDFGLAKDHHEVYGRSKGLNDRGSP